MGQISKPRIKMKTSILIFAIVSFCVGCASLSANKSPESAKFATISLKVSGDGGPLGVLMVSHGTGSINVCGETCRAIGKTEPSGSQDIVLMGGGIKWSPLANDAGYVVYIANVVTGRVTSCVVKVTYDAKGRDTLKGSGQCFEVGTPQG